MVNGRLSSSSAAGWYRSDYVGGVHGWWMKVAQGMGRGTPGFCNSALDLAVGNSS